MARVAAVAVLVAIASSAVVYADTDPCAEVNSHVGACDFLDACWQCVLSTGCAFDIEDRFCYASKWAPAVSSSSSSHANGGVHYCANADRECVTCVLSSHQGASCTGVGGCLCPAVCNALTPAKQSCHSHERLQLASVALAILAFLLPLLPWLWRRCGRDPQAADALSLLLVRGRGARYWHPGGERAAGRARRPTPELALQLDGWRADCEQLKMDGTDPVELGSCYTLMPSESDHRYHGDLHGEAKIENEHEREREDVDEKKMQTPDRSQDRGSSQRSRCSNGSPLIANERGSELERARTVERGNVALLVEHEESKDDGEAILIV